jgi:ATP adenylyltransferase
MIYRSDKTFCILKNIDPFSEKNMKHLYAPWRGSYLKRKKDSTMCPFCFDSAKSDAEHYIIKRFEHCAILLNIFPYNAGHVLIIPYAHEKELLALDQKIRAQMMELLAKAIHILQTTLKNTATNIGINVGGKAAGGTVPDHLHIHVLPRWEGDTNFLPTLADTKSISCDLNAIYEQLRTAFKDVTL